MKNVVPSEVEGVGGAVFCVESVVGVPDVLLVLLVLSAPVALVVVVLLLREAVPVLLGSVARPLAPSLLLASPLCRERSCHAKRLPKK